MYIKKIQIENFFSISKIEIDFTEYQGIVELVGKNFDSQISDSNGAGKSSVFEAIYWVLTGKTIRPKIQADGVVNSKIGKDTKVKMWFEINDVEYVVTRYRKHSEHNNKLYFGLVDDEEALTKLDNRDTQNQIYKTLDMSPDLIRYLIFFGSQDVKPFIEMSPNEITALFEKVLGYEMIDMMIEKAKEKVRNLEYEQQQIIMDKKAKEKELNMLLAELDKKKIYYEKEKKKVEDNLLKLEAKQYDIDIYKTKKQQLIDAITKVEALKPEYEELMQKRTEYMRKMQGYVMQINQYNMKIEMYEDNIKELEEYVIPSTCENCGRPYTKQMMKERQKQINKEKRELQKILKQNIKYRDELQKEYDKYKELRDELDGKIVGIEDAINSEKILKAELKNVEDILKQIEKHYDNIDQYKRYMEENLEQIKDEIAGLKVRIDNAKEEIESLEIDIEAAGELLSITYEFVNLLGTRGVKGSYYDVVLPILNEYLDQFLTELNMYKVKFRKKRSRGNWVIELVVDDVGYYNKSDGEKTLLNLAISLSFYIFFRNYSGKGINIFLMDEPFNSLDDGSAEAVLALLRRVNEYVPSIWVISHNHNLKDIVDMKFVVYKKDGLTYQLEN